MADLRQLHRYMTDRRRVLLEDGRVGRIVRVDTNFPARNTTVSIWTDSSEGPGVTKVGLGQVVGLDKQSA